MTLSEGQYTRVVYYLIKERNYTEAVSHLEDVLQVRYAAWHRVMDSRTVAAAQMAYIAGDHHALPP
jgi:hypothetical protein